MSASNGRFPLGRLVVTPAAIGAVSRDMLFQFIERHLSGDWGDVSENDARSNEYALRHELRIISIYLTPSGERIMVLTEADRSATTILMANEY